MGGVSQEETASVSWRIGVQVLCNWGKREKRHTIAAILHTSVLAPHLAPSITSGERYCRVWMSFVK